MQMDPLVEKLPSGRAGVYADGLFGRKVALWQIPVIQACKVLTDRRHSVSVQDAVGSK